MAAPSQTTLHAESINDLAKLFFETIISGVNADGTNYFLPTGPQSTTANILAGYQTFTSTTAATTLITVPQGRTWVGTVGASCSAQEAAAGTVAAQARAVITTAGTNVTPAAGTYLAVEAKVGANAAGGTVGAQGNNAAWIPLVVVAPAGNSVTVQVASTNAGTASVVDAFASGMLQ